jgi:hypothetical protein
MFPWNSIFNFEALITKCPNIGDDIIKNEMNIPNFEKRPFKNDVEVSTLEYKVRQPNINKFFSVCFQIHAVNSDFVILDIFLKYLHSFTAIPKQPFRHVQHTQSRALAICCNG